MKKKPTNVYLSPEARKALDDIGERNGMTANQIASAALAELAKINPDELWQALGRITATGESAQPFPVPKIGRGQRDLLPA